MHLSSLRTDTQGLEGSRTRLCSGRTEAKYECTCPVCGHARKYKRDQDLSSAVVETRKTSTSAPVQSADRHTSTKLFLHLSEAGRVKQASGIKLHKPKKGGGGYLCHAEGSVFKKV